MSPEQVQSEDLTERSDLYSLGAVAYELLTGFRPFRGSNLSKLLHQIVYASPAPMHGLRPDVPEELEAAVMVALQKNPAKRHATGLEFAAALTRVYQQLRRRSDRLDRQEQFDLMRRLRFFHDFSHEEIWEILRASAWQTCQPGEEIVREGEMDERFYIIVSGEVAVTTGGREVGRLSAGECFGESSYVRGARRSASIQACEEPVTLIRVSATQLEQASAASQLRFNKVFLRSLIQRLQSVGKST
jgi:hypothetical protein